ncbi:TetR family transcriptional regulator [Sphingorhabdus sp. YGSMI21]|uniref:TetR family transcriptional regulator n=1 Tax=Sphingorhabdus sp. YGSMI21 TaxID=2077182 RepID=UPI000C1F3107|nr:TetR family transcriptional regulator [Sphingorhabdus sp. YGSMI21]ATW04279.1 hypothetical protein CHN51_12600 [Sphingorhabdus sp. YGSMI21]
MMARRTDIVLSQDMICVAALEIIGESGLDRLTMRSLARKLEIQAASLYAHYRDKSELMSDLAARYFLEACDAVYDWSSPGDWLMKFGSALYSVLRERRDAARLFAQSQPPVHSHEVTAENASSALTASGWSVNRAVEMQAAVIALAIGMALDHSHEGTSAYLERFFDLDEAFQTALSALVSGLLDKPVTAMDTPEAKTP